MLQDSLLFEILTEELPPKALKALSHALCEGVRQGLMQAELDFKTIESFATPRRLALIVCQLAEKQKDQKNVRKGPLLTQAIDDFNQPTAVGLGFAKSCGVDFSALEKIETEQGVRLSYQVVSQGKSVQELLPEIINQALKKLPIPKLMRWGSGEIEFVRPVHRVILLYGEKTIPANILGKIASNQTEGHRFLSPEVIKINTATEYETVLQQHCVIASFEKRRESIHQQIITLANQEKGKVIIDQALLDEVTGLVEYPIAMLGSFDPAFLALPKEALILSMQQHQRCFALENLGVLPETLLDKSEISIKSGWQAKRGSPAWRMFRLRNEHDGGALPDRTPIFSQDFVDSTRSSLLPRFIFISNIKSLSPDEVIQGNERVIRARLKDAMFFYEKDLKTPLENQTQKLKQMIYQKGLGDLFEKTERLIKVVILLAGQKNSNINLAHAKRAAFLAKADLMTQMVSEFPELQGVMGKYYALAQQEDPAVAIALQEQYLPKYAGDILPESELGQILALADRVDLLVGIFGINKKPTGEKDPFGLRRAALGLIRILIEKKWQINLDLLISKTIENYNNSLPNKNIEEELLKFIQDRFSNWAIDQGFSASEIAAVFAIENIDYYDIHARLKAIQAFKNLPEAESLISANKRVHNLLAKQEIAILPELNTKLFQEMAEKSLWGAILAQQEKINIFYQDKNYIEYLKNLALLKNAIDLFFDQVLILTDDKALRENRLSLLLYLRKLFLKIADISKL